jgi:hypothetical protein
MIGRVPNAAFAVASMNILVSQHQPDVSVLIVEVRFTNEASG